MNADHLLPLLHSFANCDLTADLAREQAHWIDGEARLQLRLGKSPRRNAITAAVKAGKRPRNDRRAR